MRSGLRLRTLDHHECLVPANRGYGYPIPYRPNKTSKQALPANIGNWPNLCMISIGIGYVKVSGSMKRGSQQFHIHVSPLVSTYFAGAWLLRLLAAFHFSVTNFIHVHL
jgi:hypothetical protein